MKTKTIKTEAEVIAATDAMFGDRPYIEVTTKDGSTITEVRIGALRLSSLYGMTVLRELEHEEGERYRVRVDHPAFPSLNRYFESEFGEARTFQNTYEAIADATVTAGMVKVLIDDKGAVVAELTDDGCVQPLTEQDPDYIPF